MNFPAASHTIVGCPFCKYRFAVPYSQIGEKQTCPACQGGFHYRCPDNCPRCSKRVNVRAEYLGALVRCKDCREEFRVLAPVSCSHCGSTQKISPAEIGGQRVCSACSHSFEIGPVPPPCRHLKPFQLAVLLLEAYREEQSTPRQAQEQSLHLEQRHALQAQYDALLARLNELNAHSEALRLERDLLQQELGQQKAAEAALTARHTEALEHVRASLHADLHTRLQETSTHGEQRLSELQQQLQAERDLLGGRNQLLQEQLASTRDDHAAQLQAVLLQAGSLEGQLREAQQAAEDQQFRAAALDASLRELQSRLDGEQQLREQLEARLESTLLEARTHSDQLRGEKLLLQGQLNSARHDHATQQEALHATVEALRQELAELSHGRAGAEAAARHLEAEVARLREVSQQNEHLVDLARQRHEQVQALQAQVETLQQHSSSLEGQLREARQAAQDQQFRAAELAARLHELQGQLDGEQHLREQLEAHLHSKLHEASTHSDQRLSELQQQLQAECDLLRGEKQLLQEQLDLARDDHAAQRETLHATVEALRQELADLSHGRAGAEAAARQLEAEVARLREVSQESDQTQELAQQRQEHLQALQAQLEAWQQQAAAMQEQLRDARQAAQDQQFRAAELDARLGELHSQLLGEQQRREQLERSLHQEQQAREAAVARANGLLEKQQNNRAELSQIEATCAALQLERKYLQEQVLRREEDQLLAEQLSAKVLKLEADLLAARKATPPSESALVAAQQEAAKQRQAAEAERQRAGDLLKQVERLQSEASRHAQEKESLQKVSQEKVSQENESQPQVQALQQEGAALRAEVVRLQAALAHLQQNLAVTGIPYNDDRLWQMVAEGALSLPTVPVIRPLIGEVRPLTGKPAAQEKPAGVGMVVTVQPNSGMGNK